MKAEILHTLTAQLVHLGAMPGEAEIMANHADNTLPVNDWKHHRYIATEDTIKRIARHFIEIGKHMKEGEK